MSDQVLRVHQLAALAGVTVKTLHHYDRVGLLQPRRTASGYRVYAATDVTRLRQILALRALGLPLRRIRTLLGPDAPPLHLALRQQREVLEGERRLLDRTIAALRVAEIRLEAEPAHAPDTLQTLLEVIGMDDGIDSMRKYYSDEAWEAWRHHYEQWPSPTWCALYRDINAVLDDGAPPSPESAEAQALGERWLALDRGETRVGAVRVGMRRAWEDREHWPLALRARIEELRIERAMAFINTVLWERWDAERVVRDRAGHAPARVSDARVRLYRDGAAALAAHREQKEAAALVARWRAILHAECGGDEAMAAEQIRAWRHRHDWPPGLRRYMASCYGMDDATWMQVADLIDTAAARAV